ncbi:MAG: PASTA domain-containing protein [Candidatus Hydrogenedentes bacterium]|nr:PASTA domain-containing protein [Candidatus Hydrogenedentota bacterium]
MKSRKNTVLLLIITLFSLTSRIAFPQLSPQQIEELKKQAKTNGWAFEIGETSATRRQLSSLLGYIPPDPEIVSQIYPEEEPLKPIEKLPSRWDWRERTSGGLPPIRDQGECGSCWAFATVGALECNIKIKDGINVDLSEQWLVDCARGIFWYGCDGGISAHDWHKGTQTDSCGGYGAVLEVDYPYVGYQKSCGCPVPHYYTIRDWKYVGSAIGIPPIDSIKTAIYRYGPVVCAMEVKSSFLAYKGGLYNDKTESKALPNHMVVIVGWDDNYGSGAFIIRNSWGPYWGENGYAYIEYGVAQIGYAANYIQYGEPYDPLIITPQSELAFLCSSNNFVSPNSITIKLENSGETNISWSVASDQWLQIQPTSGTLSPGGFTNISLTLLQIPATPGTYQKSFTITNNTTQKTSTFSVKIKRAFPAPITFTLDQDPGWEKTGNWQFGVPQGRGGDPSSGYTGSNVLGYNLNGNYEDNMEEEYLISDPIDCSSIKNVSLSFYRWLGIEDSDYDHARIDISTNGTDWIKIWEHTDGSFQENRWTYCSYNISNYANQSPLLIIRWVMGPTDYSVNYSGWNIDDITITGDPVYTTIPYLIGKTLQEALSILASSNLTQGTLTWTCHNSVPENKIILQTPSPGSSVPIGSTVNLTISSGPCYISVPNVINLPNAQAQSILINSGLSIGNISYACNSQIPEGNVISQFPEANTQVQYGSSVELLISTGPCPSEGEGEQDGSYDGEGTPLEGNIEGIPIEGYQEGSIEEGEGEEPTEGISEGTPEGTTEGILEGSSEGSFEGVNEEGTDEGSLNEGAYEGTSEGTSEGTGEGNAEGSQEGENTEGQTPEGEYEGAHQSQFHSADINKDNRINLSEVLRVIQFFNLLGYHCGTSTEDGYIPGPGENHDCSPHSSDYNPQDWTINLQELLRLIQLFNSKDYYPCYGASEDNFCIE